MERKYVDIKSPFTGGRVMEISDVEEKEFRKEKFRVHVRYYVCEDTSEQFTTTEQDTLQFNELYSQYRVRHGIPFPEEIREIRLRYGLNYSQISRILGFGTNQYAKYENGEVPSESNGKMIAAIRNKDVMIDLLRNCNSVFQSSEYERILTSIVNSPVRPANIDPLFQIIYKDGNRSILNGYGNKSVAKLFDMVGYIVKRHSDVFPTKLNKLMFYADFCNYRESGSSISGLQYRAVNFGPIPEHYATIYDNATDLEKRFVETHGTVGTLFSYRGESDFNNLSVREKEVIDKVVNRLKSMTVAEIIERSHNESGWLNNYKTHDFIPYDEAFKLKLL